jgi:Carboxypeptidase regulatory-like domain/TonB-dependent Receptor Plug Domain
MQRMLRAMHAQIWRQVLVGTRLQMAYPTAYGRDSQTASTKIFQPPPAWLQGRLTLDRRTLKPGFSLRLSIPWENLDSRQPAFGKSGFSGIWKVTMRTPRQREHLLDLPGNGSARPATFLGGRLTAFAAAGAIALTLLSARATAQQSGTLRGTVVTSENKPLPQARISVVGTSLAAVADTDGAFRIVALPIGGQSIEVKLLGYATTLIPVQIETGRDANLRVALTAIPVELRTVKVTADPLVLPEMRRFAERRARGSGTFFTRADIDRMEARLFTDILRRVPGMQIETFDGAFGPTYSVQTSRNLGTNGGHSCQMQFFVNGVPFNSVGELAINHFVSPGEVAAVEVYNGASQIPPEYNSSMYNSRCGVVLIWTRISTSASRSN